MVFNYDYIAIPQLLLPTLEIVNLYTCVRRLLTKNKRKSNSDYFVFYARVSKDAESDFTIYRQCNFPGSVGIALDFITVQRFFCRKASSQSWLSTALFIALGIYKYYSSIYRVHHFVSCCLTMVSPQYWSWGVTLWWRRTAERKICPIINLVLEKHYHSTASGRWEMFGRVTLSFDVIYGASFKWRLKTELFRHCYTSVGVYIYIYIYIYV